MVSKSTAVAQYVRNDSVQQRMEELLGNRTPQITTSLLTAVNANDKLAKCKPETVLNAALTAASMDLPINANLGFAYIIPYENNKKVVDDSGRESWVKVNEAQFQMGWKGFIQLAQRSGFYRTINASDVREGEIKLRNRLTGEIEFEWIESDEERENKKIVGYVGYFELLEGFTKSLYMSVEQLDKHAEKYSKSYAYDKKSGKQSSKWTTDFDAMSLKTVIKLLISKYGPMSTQLQEAIVKDQAVIEEDAIRYVDNDQNERDVKSRGLNKWIPSDDRPMNENQEMVIKNLLRQQMIESDDDINNWTWDNYGVGYADLTEAQAAQITADLDTRGQHEETEKTKANYRPEGRIK